MMQIPWDVPVDLFFYREPEELEKAEEAQAPYQEPPAVAAPGWGAEPIVGAAPTGAIDGFVPPVDPTAVPMEQYQAPPPAGGDAALGGGWDAAPAEPIVEQPPAEQQPLDEVIAVDAGMAAGGGWDAAPDPQVAGGGGWGESSAQGAGGW